MSNSDLIARRAVLEIVAPRNTALARAIEALPAFKPDLAYYEIRAELPDGWIGHRVIVSVEKVVEEVDGA
jgi:hypothetical protein